MKAISKLHYITHDHKTKSHIDLVSEACKYGIDWIQLRMKDSSDEEIYDTARQCKEITQSHKRTLILNDHVHIAKDLNLDGVHLGLTDMPINDARKLLGEDKIIGGTANTLDDIKLQINRGADYIGYGPYKFTQTKKNLSPVLGIKGYLNLQNEHITKPIIAIGGIKPEDCSSLVNAVVHGIAVSSGIGNALNMKQKINEYKIRI